MNFISCVYSVIIIIMPTGRKKAKDDPRYAKYFKMKRLVSDTP